MVMERPKLNSKVILTEDPDSEGWIVNAPHSGHYYRIGDVEYTLLSYCNGARTVIDIAKELSKRYTRPISPENLNPAITKLTELSLIESPSSASITCRPESASPNRQSPLFFTIRAFNPGKLLTLIYPIAKRCLNVKLVVGAAVFTLISLVTVLTNFADVVFQLKEIKTRGFGEAAVTAYLLMIPLGLIHELAHGSVARYYGLRVTEMGLLFIYFSPAFYIDVSAAWRLPRKQRLAISFAGVFVDLFLSTTALMLWTVLPESGLSGLLFIFGLTGLVSSLTNLNPLIRLDGYYLLADLLRMPNLRTRAFLFLRRLMRSRRSAIQGVRRQEQRTYITYGTIAFCYSAGLLVWTTYMFSQLFGEGLGRAAYVIGALFVPTSIGLLALIDRTIKKRFIARA